MNGKNYSVVEILLYWHDGFSTEDLCTHLGIGRTKAQKLISDYREHFPQQLRFDQGLKQYVAEVGFTPHFINSEASRYLDYVRARGLTDHFLEQPEGPEPVCEDLDLMLRPSLDTNNMRYLLAALHRQQAISIFYWAKNHRCNRVISPNHLVFADNRYHMRSYCHDTGYYLDFVLSRITHVGPSDQPWQSAQGDEEWKSYEKLVFALNPDLPEETRQALAFDYHLSDGKLTKRCRKALSFYVERQLLSTVAGEPLPRWQLVSRTVSSN